MVKQQAGIDIPEQLARHTVDAWRHDNPLITRAWKLINSAFLSAMAGRPAEWAGFKFSRAGSATVVVTMPNGYELFYPNPYFRGRDLFWVVDGEEKKIYGGHLLENFMQALGAQLLRLALVKLEKHAEASAFGKGGGVVLHVYDETVAEADDKKAAKVAKLIADTMREAPPWAPAMKLEVEQKITKRWGK